MAFSPPCIKPHVVPPQAYANLMEQGVEPLAAAIFAGRGISQREEIVPPLMQLPLPEQLPGVVEMAQALAAAIRAGEKIAVIGDYDADGVTATVIAYDCLCRMGAAAAWYIPRREEGYGLSPAIAEAQADAGVRHLITVDNGTTAHAGVERAQQLGMRVYVTDHHLPDERASAADYLVNPIVNHGACAALSQLTGVGISFYVMAQLRRELGSELDINRYLDLVALGTIADCAKMDSANRALSGAGLRRLRQGQGCLGMVALAKRKKINLKNINSQDIGFRIAPLVNSAGRMDSADIAMQCLLTDDRAAVSKAADALEKLNSRRRQHQDAIFNQLQQQADPNAAAIVAYDADWHAGVMGPIAGKIAQQFHRPAFVFSQGENGHWRGSGRTPPGYDLIAVLKALCASHPSLFVRFGGHCQAASATLTASSMQDFQQHFVQACQRIATDVEPPPIRVDEAEAEQITYPALVQLEDAVWGREFSPPLYCGSFDIVESTPLNGDYLRLTLSDCASGISFPAVYFGGNTISGKKINILYRAEINNYNKEAQIIVEQVLSAGD